MQCANSRKATNRLRTAPQQIKMLHRLQHSRSVLTVLIHVHKTTRNRSIRGESSTPWTKRGHYQAITKQLATTCKKTPKTHRSSVATETTNSLSLSVWSKLIPNNSTQNATRRTSTERKIRHQKHRELTELNSPESKPPMTSNEHKSASAIPFFFLRRLSRLRSEGVALSLSGERLVEPRKKKKGTNFQGDIAVSLSLGIM